MCRILVSIRFDTRCLNGDESSSFADTSDSDTVGVLDSSVTNSPLMEFVKWELLLILHF